MRRLSLIVVLLRAAVSIAQPVVGNEWIDYDRQYWRFDVYRDGLHRLDSATLAASGFPVSTVDPAHLMLFGREKQIPIYIEGGDDGVLNAGDFIEFVGRKNDGWIDTRMYPTSRSHANPHYSLFNDTIHYFLTWDPDPAVVKQRVLPYSDPQVDAHVLRPWVWGKGLTAYSDAYWPGLVSTQYGFSSGLMLEAEGWGGAALLTVGADVSGTVSAPTPRAYAGAGAPAAEVCVVVAGQEWEGHGIPEHHLRVKAGVAATVRLDTVYSDNAVIRSCFTLPPEEVGASVQVTLELLHDLPLAQSAPNYLDLQVPVSCAIKYPRDLQAVGAGPMDLWIPHDATDPSARLALGGVQGTPIVYCFGDVPRRVMPLAQGAGWEFAVPTHPDSARTPTYIHTEQAIIRVGSLEPVNGGGFFQDFAAASLDSALLIVTHRSLWNGAMAYAEYRSTQAPAPMPALVADVDELYDQYGGGVPKSAWAIRAFARHLFDAWQVPPQGLFLIGKSTPTSAQAPVQGTRPDVFGAYARSLVPTYGYPACDQCFSIGLHFDQRSVDIPVGRLSATREEQVFQYLGKVREFEAQRPAPWMKNFVHLSGGFTAAEQQMLANRLRDMEPFVGDNSSFGAQVTRFRKNSSEVFSAAAADSVRTLIENGVSVLNFFAHAYSESFDITIDDPGNYQWNGRYPFVIGNSCYIGNVHLNADAASTSEKWVMRDRSGPVAFLSATDLSEVYTLGAYGERLYSSIGSVNYGAGFGQHMKHAAREMLVNPSNWIAVHAVHTFTLQGDPMLVLNSPARPDFEVLPTDISTDPSTVTADVDSFAVKVAVRNIGRIVPGPVGVQLQRSIPGSSTVATYNGQLMDMGFQDTIVFRLPTRGTGGGQGINQLTVRVDLDPDMIEEEQRLPYGEAGVNEASTTILITSGDLVPTYPYDLAIVPEPRPTLKASTGDPLAGIRNYVFQIDTTDLFNSPMLETAMISATGGVVSWQPVRIYALNTSSDSTVFFWRCSIDSVGNGSYNWYERSFQYIQGKRGWGQAHYFQFKNDEFSSVVYDRPERDFDFTNAPHEMAAFTSYPISDVGWRLELENQDLGGCSADPAWNLVVVDPYTFEPWGTRYVDNSASPPVIHNPDHDFGNHPPCRPRVMNFFHFRQNSPDQMAALAELLTSDETIPDGYHILMYTWFYMDIDGMSQTPAVLSALNGLGMPDFSTLQDSVPYIFYARKGFPETYVDTTAVDGVTRISLTAFASSSGDRGFISTRDAGPARAWHKLYWDEVPSSGNDSTVIQIRGLAGDGVQLVDLAEFRSEQDSVIDLPNYVDAAMFPKLRLRGKFHDLAATQPKPAQMKRWQLLYDPVPECAIDPARGHHHALDGLFQGQSAEVAVAITNISEFDMDSLLVTAWVINAANQRHRIWYKRNAPLPAGAVLMDTIRFDTWGFGGINTLMVEANPVDTLTGAYDQLEQYHFNNVVQWRFDVAVDRENPLLDVTFDGIHILDGDIISARPEIEISLNDENTVMLLDSPADTAQFKIFLTRPGRPIERVFFRDGQGNEALQFFPANGPENEARIMYRPRLTDDGKYLLTVQAMDLSRNASGDHDYKVSFEVINRSTITEVLNYPNPFTTNTRFVFTLTGITVPTYMKIQIMTVTGRVVREVKMHELGPMRVGRNITDFAWDGTDEFGDRLARGVYLYRVIAQINGEDIEYRATDAASYFTKGFGKMYKL
ncbi:MAG: hypothetical protein KF797_12525 [Flavobacteriales bacterium]|nr:hypothetical protein [Flavobacteriales bacterium]